MVMTSLQPALLPAYVERDEANNEPFDDEVDFAYGFRYTLPGDAEQHYPRVPLTLDDILHPREDDHVNQVLAHVLMCHELFAVLRDWLRDCSDLVVLCDGLLFLDTQETKSYGPDIAVLRDVHTIPKHEAYKPSKHGGYPLFVVEVTSNSTRHTDVSLADPERSKYLHYQRLGIPYYFIIDEARQTDDHPPAIWGYELRYGRYTELKTDSHGRFWIPPLAISLGPYETDVAWYDAEGKRILNLAEQRERAEQERARAEQERARAKQAETRVEQERARAEQERIRAEHAEARACALEEELKRLKEQSGLSD